MATSRSRAVQRTSPPGFRPTGRGLAAALPNFPATDALATGYFFNRARTPKDGYLYKMPLFIKAVNTNYSVSGDYSQTSSVRTFYPKNFSQDVITITLLFANSFEYDKMVDFVRQHMWDALDTLVDDPNNGANGTASQSVEFKLFPFYVQAGKDANGQQIYREIYGGIPGGAVNAASSNGVHVAGYIQGCQAGLERFQFARSMDIQLKVSYDYLEDQPQISALSNKILQQNVLNGLATNLYARKKGHVVPPQQLNPDGTPIYSTSGATPGSDAGDVLWNQAKIAQLNHSGVT